jgi:hypothetical protein
MELVDMAMTKAERKSTLGGCDAVPTSQDSEDKGPRYPYGLELSLEKVSIEKLGLDFKSMSVGDEINIDCKGKITRISQNERVGEGADKSVSIQITAMGIDTEELGWDTSPGKAAKILGGREE